MRPTLFALSTWLAAGLLAAGLAAPVFAQRGGDAVRTEDRFNALERQNAALTGQVEQLQYRIQQLQQQLERMQADYEFRLNQIEGAIRWKEPETARRELRSLEEDLDKARARFSGIEWAAAWIDWNARLERVRSQLPPPEDDRPRP